MAQLEEKVQNWLNRKDWAGQEYTYKNTGVENQSLTIWWSQSANDLFVGNGSEIPEGYSIVHFEASAAGEDIDFDEAGDDDYDHFVCIDGKWYSYTALWRVSHIL